MPFILLLRTTLPLAIAIPKPVSQVVLPNVPVTIERLPDPLIFMLKESASTQLITVSPPLVCSAPIIASSITAFPPFIDSSLI